MRLTRRRVYILPTRQGLLYGVTVFVMLLGSMNYSNSMGFILTFVLTGLGFVAMHTCHANLAGLEIAARSARPVFSGETAHFELQVTNWRRTPRVAITLGADARDAVISGELAMGEPRTLAVPVRTARRGWLSLTRLTVGTTYPFALFRAWSWVHMDLRVLVYPKPADLSPPLPPAVGNGQDGRPTDAGEEDFTGLRLYQPGDSPGRIAWKSSVRTRKLLTKLFTGGGEQHRWFDWDDLTGFGPEERLSMLCRWVLIAYAQNLSYGLRLPNQVIPISSGDVQRVRCLERLALFVQPDDRSG